MTKDIVLICDDNYCLPTIVCIQSIIENADVQNDGITIHVCTFGLSEENLEMLRRMDSESIKIVIETFDQEVVRNRIQHIIQKSHVTPSALIKFELPHYFNQLDSILYLDSDTIVKGNLQDLLKQDVSNNYLAASYEFWEHLRRIRYTLHRSVSPYFYFNSGVMLMNIKKMRENRIPDKLWEYKLYQAKTTLMDQESLNAVCGKKTLPLSIQWNFNPAFLHMEYLREIKKVYGEEYCTTHELESEVKIIHYVGKKDKPWIYQSAHLREYWDIAYCASSCTIPLLDRKEEQVRRSFFTQLKYKLSTQGIYGTFCYAFYLIEQKIQKK